MSIKKIIINADDYGLSPLFNKGILDLIEKGIVTSTTIMIKRKYVRPSIFKKFKDISIGLHLELEEKDTLKEIQKQIDLFVKKFKKLPSHLDGHHHLHLTKENIPKIIKIAKKYSLAVRSYKNKDQKILKKNGIKTLDAFVSWHPERIGKLKEKIRKVKGKKVELVCHPGYYDSRSTYPYNKQREQELKFLKSSAFKKMIKKFKLIKYAET